MIISPHKYKLNYRVRYDDDRVINWCLLSLQLPKLYMENAGLSTFFYTEAESFQQASKG